VPRALNRYRNSWTRSLWCLGISGTRRSTHRKGPSIAGTGSSRARQGGSPFGSTGGDKPSRRRRGGAIIKATRGQVWPHRYPRHQRRHRSGSNPAGQLAAPPKFWETTPDQWRRFVAVGTPRLLDLKKGIPARDRFAPDSPLEGGGFEPSVPREAHLRCPKRNSAPHGNAHRRRRHRVRSEV
jgi:hypothetical protein